MRKYLWTHPAAACIVGVLAAADVVFRIFVRGPLRESL